MSPEPGGHSCGCAALLPMPQGPQAMAALYPRTGDPLAPQGRSSSHHLHALELGDGAEERVPALLLDGLHLPLEAHAAEQHLQVLHRGPAGGEGCESHREPQQRGPGCSGGTGMWHVMGVSWCCWCSSQMISTSCCVSLVVKDACRRRARKSFGKMAWASFRTRGSWSISGRVLGACRKHPDTILAPSPRFLSHLYNCRDGGREGEGERESSRQVRCQGREKAWGWTGEGSGDSGSAG